MQSNPGNPPKAQRAAPTDLYARVPAFDQLPDYQAYLNRYHALPSSREGGCSLGWNYPTPPASCYDRALPSYLGQVLQSQTPYGCGGPRRSAPCPPPVYAPRPAAPNESARQVEDSTLEQRTRVHYPAVVELANDPESASQGLASRLIGSTQRVAAFTTLQPAPTENHDSLHLERLGAYFILQRDSSLRYHVDTGRFFRTYTSGESREVLNMAQVTQILRQEHPDRWVRLGQLLNHLPYDQHLFGPPAVQPRPGKLPAPPAPLLTFQPIPVPAPILPRVPAVEEARPTSQPRLAAKQDAGQVADPVPVPLKTEALPPAPPAPPAGPEAPFTLTVHRYWDVPAGAYSEVQEVLIQGGLTSAHNEPAYNTEEQPCFVFTRSLPLGKSVRITVTWANGQTRVWDQRISDPGGSADEVYSPLG